MKNYNQFLSESSNNKNLVYIVTWFNEIILPRFKENSIFLDGSHTVSRFDVYDKDKLIETGITFRISNLDKGTDGLTLEYMKAEIDNILNTLDDVAERIIVANALGTFHLIVKYDNIYDENLERSWKAKNKYNL